LRGILAEFTVNKKPRPERPGNLRRGRRRNFKKADWFATASIDKDAPLGKKVS